MGKHAGRIGIIEVGSSSTPIARRAQQIESKAAPSRPREKIDGPVDIGAPNVAHDVAFNVEYSARDRKVGDLSGTPSYLPFPVVALTVKFSRLLNHFWCDVI